MTRTLIARSPLAAARRPRGSPAAAARPTRATRSPRRRRRRDAKLSLVAYSTPQVVYDEIIPAFKKTAGGQGRRRSRLLRRLGRAEPRRRGRPEGRRRLFSLEPDMDAPRRGRPRRPGLGRRAAHDGLVTTSVVVVRRPQGQPEGHQDLGRPAQAGRRGPHAEPVHLGRREVEPARRLRPGVGRRQGPAGRPRLRRQADQGPRQGPGQVRPRGAADVHLRQGRRPALLRVRGDHRAEEGRGRRLRRPGRHDHDREPDRRRPRTRRPQAQAFLDYVLSEPGAAEVRRLGLPPGRTRRSLEANKAKFPDAARPVHDRRPRRLVEGQRRAVRSRTTARSPRSRRTRGCRPPSERA